MEVGAGGEVWREQKRLAKKGGELRPCCIVLFLQIENPRYLRENPIPLSPVSAKASYWRGEVEKGRKLGCFDDFQSAHLISLFL